MLKKTAIEKAGSATALAGILDINLSAISQWKKNVPELRIYKLRELKPEWFVEPEHKARTRKTKQAA